MSVFQEHATNHNIPKTAYWIQDPWKLEEDEEGENRSADPILDRLFPDGRPVPAGESVFQNPVIINGPPQVKYVFELNDLIEHARRRKGFFNPLTNAEYTLKDLNPVRFPGFQNYAETLRQLKHITLNAQRWTDLPVPDAPDAPRVGLEMRMPYSVRPERGLGGARPYAADGGGPALGAMLGGGGGIKSRKRQDYSGRKFQGLPIMQRVLTTYAGDVACNTRVTLAVLANRFRALAAELGNMEMAEETDVFVRDLLTIISKNQVPEGGAENLEIIHTAKSGMAFLLNAKPLMRLAHLFLATFLQKLLVKEKSISGVQMTNMLDGESVIREFRQYIIDTEHAMNPLFTDQLLYVALNNLQGVQVERGNRNQRVIRLNMREILPLTPTSGLNESHLLKRPLFPTGPRNRPRAAGDLEAAVGEGGGASHLIQDDSDGDAHGGDGSGVPNLLLAHAPHSAAGQLERGEHDESLSAAEARVRQRQNLFGRASEFSSLRASRGPIVIQDDDPFEFPPQSASSQRGRQPIRRRRILRDEEEKGAGATHISLLTDALQRFVEQFVQIEEIGNLDQVYERFLDFCASHGIGIRASTFPSATVMEHIVQTPGVHSVAPLGDGGPIQEIQYSIGFGIPEDYDEIGPPYQQIERHALNPFHRNYEEIIHRFIQQYMPPKYFPNWQSLQSEFSRFCAELGVNWNSSAYSDHDMLTAWLNMDGVRQTSAGDRPGPQLGDGGMRGVSSGYGARGEEEGFVIGYDIPGSP